MRGAWAWPLLALALAGSVFAADPPAGASPHSTATLRDREFGVSTRQFGLQRAVEMYQWQRGVDGRYRAVWSARALGSAGHGERFANPAALPLPTRYWIAGHVTFDGRPLDEDVLKALGTWRTFRPGFTALPGNLAATFQPEGDGLGSAENPLDPQVGDLRVTWRELTLPALQGRVALQDGIWRLAPDAPAAARRSPAGQAAASEPAARAAPSNHRWPAWSAWFAWPVLAVLVAGVAVLLLRARRGRAAR